MKEWIFKIDRTLTAELAKDFGLGPLMDNGKRLLEEQTIASLNGLTIEVFSREHPPPHFRVTYQGESNNFDICTGQPLEGNALKKWRRNILSWHAMHRDELINAWNRLRPSDCPVGDVV